MTPEEEARVNEWLKEHLKPDRLHLLDDANASEWRHITRVIPCHIRCWRIGGPVDVKPGERCPECGKEAPWPTRYDRLRED